eukprot:TRINITY_DN658_c1_g1_i2.p1 TRINITY_DN658_c1_g1~~TRINITY_DN658_c1_g1_i2.p1  ORF type:complete len:773 (+),score=180.93 TRINITY_DN658_c1_g1_i2:91-2319(+)
MPLGTVGTVREADGFIDPDSGGDPVCFQLSSTPWQPREGDRVEYELAGMTRALRVQRAPRADSADPSSSSRPCPTEQAPVAEDERSGGSEPEGSERSGATKRDGSDQGQQAQRRPASRAVCRDWEARGECARGGNCMFPHPPNLKLCRWHPGCKRKDCRYNHPPLPTADRDRTPPRRSPPRPAGESFFSVFAFWDAPNNPITGEDDVSDMLPDMWGKVGDCLRDCHGCQWDFAKAHKELNYYYHSGVQKKYAVPLKQLDILRRKDWRHIDPGARLASDMVADEMHQLATKGRNYREGGSPAVDPDRSVVVLISSNGSLKSAVGRLQVEGHFTHIIVVHGDNIAKSWKQELHRSGAALVQLELLHGRRGGHPPKHAGRPEPAAGDSPPSPRTPPTAAPAIGGGAKVRMHHAPTPDGRGREKFVKAHISAQQYALIPESHLSLSAACEAFLSTSGYVSLCAMHEIGKCPHGAGCNFAHLRAPHRRSNYDSFPVASVGTPCSEAPRQLPQQAVVAATHLQSMAIQLQLMQQQAARLAGEKDGLKQALEASKAERQSEDMAEMQQELARMRAACDAAKAAAQQSRELQEQEKELAEFAMKKFTAEKQRVQDLEARLSGNSQPAPFGQPPTTATYPAGRGGPPPAPPPAPGGGWPPAAPGMPRRPGDAPGMSPGVPPGMPKGARGPGDAPGLPGGWGGPADPAAGPAGGGGPPPGAPGLDRLPAGSGMPGGRGRGRGRGYGSAPSPF